MGERLYSLASITGRLEMICVRKGRKHILPLADCHVDVIAGTQAAILNHEVGVHCVLRMADERLKLLVPDTVDRHPSL